MRKLSLLGVCLSLALVGCNGNKEATPGAASEATPPVTPAVVETPVEQVSKTLKTRFPSMELEKVESLGGAADKELFVVHAKQFEGIPAYTNLAVDFVVVGGNFYTPSESGEMKNRTTELAKTEQNDKNAKIFSLLKELPFDQALKFQYGKGERVFVSFEDPDCPQCAMFTKQLMLDSVKANTMVYVMPMPLVENHPDAINRSKYIMCTEKPENTWSEWMVASPEQRNDWASFAQKHPSQEGCERGKVVDKVLDITAELDFRATPTLLFESGFTYHGRPDSIDVLNQSFDSVKQTLDAVKANANGQEIPVIVPPLKPFREYTDAEMAEAQAQIDAFKKEVLEKQKK